MPEGPEVRREADRIAKVVVARPLERVFFGQSHMQGATEQLAGAQVSAVRTHGKAMLTDFDNGYTVYSHNQLYGKWYIRRRDRPLTTTRQLRFALYTKTHTALLYSASSIELWDTTQLDNHPFLRKLGPDVLNEALAWRTVADLLRAPQYRNRALSSIYLDQAFLAGIGNYMRSEILFAARLAPNLKPSQLARREVGELARQTLRISQRAYATAGVTNAPAKVATLQRQGFSRRDFRFAVFDREGLACLYCGTPIAKITAGRRLYFCPACQPNTPRQS